MADLLTADKLIRDLSHSAGWRLLFVRNPSDLCGAKPDNHFNALQWDC
ncbi:hypothetical protein GBAG_1695 [Buttiauxella agrestis ATCC 33320]|uniref:Uncharacterized protein n=1 Tax=Buttiauxella agrestis ATCC 33320 TaxID=1006004 RepID=A0A085GEP4_9ENTR|nr:hypothetical protein GBAG_1695 [Buttiauxella agrestis ATCC 33320]